MSDDIKVIITQKGTIPVYTSTRVGGETDIIHDATLTGNGSSSSPLGLSQDILDQIRRGGDTFVFEFDSSQSSWIINHNLHKKPDVIVVDSAENVMTCATTYIDTNSVEITFNAPFKGTAYLN